METSAAAPSTNPLIDRIRASVIGDDEAVAGPFGIRRVTYADYTASGRSLSFIEDYIREAVLPLYANTHTESSGTGLQTSRFREEARRLVLEGVGRRPRAPRRDLLRLRAPPPRSTGSSTSSTCASRPTSTTAGTSPRGSRADQRPVVFIGPYEHHSNELPWRESIADVVMIREDREGHIDLALLREELERYADRPLRIGSFSAASNVTGIVSDTRGHLAPAPRARGAVLLGLRGGGAVRGDRDGPATGDPLAAKDAMFISPHKFIGGPGTPGVLVARRELFRNRVPSVPGGGTVAYVNPVEHVYLADIEHREEGGTPAIVESIRAGPRVRAQGGRRRRTRSASARRRSSTGRSSAGRPIPSIEILGSHQAERLSIVSFVVRHGGPLPAPQLRRGAAQRPVRDPVARRLLVRGAVRPPAARDRPGDVARVRARDRPRLRGDQARLGPGQLQLLHQRGGVRVHPRRGGPRGQRGLAAPGRLRVRRRPPACGATATERPSRRCRCATSATRTAR